MTTPSGPRASMLAVTGKYGTPERLGERRAGGTRTGIASSEPTTAIGMTGTPARMAISTKPPRPNRRSW